MNAAIEANWNSMVGPNDTVWVLGDVVLGRIQESLALIPRLNGTLILRPGNHDRCWAGHRKGVARWREEYLAAGFADIVDDPEPHVIAGRSVLLDHFPYQGDSHDQDRYADHRPTDRGSWLVHGHVHEAWRQRGRQINVGIDAWGGFPVTVDQVAELITAGPADLDPIPWVA